MIRGCLKLKVAIEEQTPVPYIYLISLSSTLLYDRSRVKSVSPLEYKGQPSFITVDISRHQRHERNACKIAVST
jgi:hypothetical protein